MKNTKKRLRLVYIIIYNNYGIPIQEMLDKTKF